MHHKNKQRVYISIYVLSMHKYSKISFSFCKRALNSENRLEKCLKKNHNNRFPIQKRIMLKIQHTRLLKYLLWQKTIKLAIIHKYEWWKHSRSRHVTIWITWPANVGTSLKEEINNFCFMSPVCSGNQGG